MTMKYLKPEIINLKSSAEYNEKWLQARIEEDPSIIGLGDLEFRYSEKMMVGGGRLDTILYDPESNRRYEVEIQLGKTDESHIIRTLEYWDIERKRNPQYEHCAVIIAEDITSRFLNVISLFNGYIPFIAIQVKAIKVGDNISLFFTKVIDEVRLDLLEEDNQSEPTDRAYWEKKSTKNMIKFVDKIYADLADITSSFNLKYNKHYIGLEKEGVANNFINFKPRKSTVIMSIRHDKSDEIDQLLNESDLDILDYETGWRRYRVRLKESDLKSNLEVIKQIVQKAKDNSVA
ncbi:hypothetical protein EQG68_10565 [Flavobacterium piscinae]|jgi:hypothetical protein|uniref:DUF5655 domain-containing protein n=3 Tax=Flavobacterium piscinae TaxID=2506424 RepID=A0A4V1N488_9FLAO|nr:hypothetical protein EQG68_10565 [Flavobacterium piscinae]